MSIVAAVNRSLGQAVRATHAETGSPYFADAALKHHLRPLEYRLAQVEQSCPELLAELADHLGTAASRPAVTTEVRARAANLLTRRQEMDTPPERYRLPRTRAAPAATLAASPGRSAPGPGAPTLRQPRPLHGCQAGPHRPLALT